MGHRIDCKVVVIGAGPAGATASLFLAKAGIEHCILDAANFPRDKVCGDGLDLKVIRVLRHLDPLIVEQELPHHPDFLPSYGARLINPDGVRLDLNFPHKPLFWTAKRRIFDDFLVKKIDPRFADFKSGARVEEIVRDGQSWILMVRNGERELEFRCNIILAADGERSLMLRYLKERSIDRRHYAATIRQYWKGVQGFHPGNLIEVYFPKALPMSYFYMFPLAGGEVNVGFGMVSDTLSANRFNLPELFEYLIKKDPHIAPRFMGAEALETPKGWGIPLASKRRKAFGDGYLLLGDAASLVCPTSGEGIGTGMISGFIAARFVERALKGNRFGAEQFHGFQHEIYRRLETEIRLYNLMRRLPPRLYELGLRCMRPGAFPRWYFRKSASRWMRTAYETPIDTGLI